MHPKGEWVGQKRASTINVTVPAVMQHPDRKPSLPTTPSYSRAKHKAAEMLTATMEQNPHANGFCPSLPLPVPAPHITQPKPPLQKTQNHHKVDHPPPQKKHISLINTDGQNDRQHNAPPRHYPTPHPSTTARTRRPRASRRSRPTLIIRPALTAWRRRGRRHHLLPFFHRGWRLTIPSRSAIILR